LLFDVGTNPDRPRPARLWLRNRYRVHQRLSMGFPLAQLKEEDVRFLLPFEQSGFALEIHNHTRTREAGFLYRIDPLTGGRVMIVVQSAIKPDWDFAFQNAPFEYHAVFAQLPEYHFEDQLRFRLEANPTRTFSKNSRGSDGELVPAELIGKRVPAEDTAEWLNKVGKKNGFEVLNGVESTMGYVSMWKSNTAKVRYRTARFEGVLVVTNESEFTSAITAGIGRGKAFGLGLLSAVEVHPNARV
jgi:CRISPR system Cascade subunit CasE